MVIVRTIILALNQAVDDWLNMLFKRLSIIEQCNQLWMVVCLNFIILCTNSHGDLAWLQLEGI